MTDQEFVELQNDIQAKMNELHELQTKHNRETGRFFIYGQPIMDNSKERLWGMPKVK